VFFNMYPKKQSTAVQDATDTADWEGRGKDGMLRGVESKALKEGGIVGQKGDKRGTQESTSAPYHLTDHGGERLRSQVR